MIAELRVWLDEALTAVPPKSVTGKALQYLASQWHRLMRYLDDGRLAIDNNGAENAIRPFVIERKTWLFSDTPAGPARRWSGASSVMASPTFRP